jgi:cellulose synthase/poly-beta-1,6-N-acetylglucosamine synthase-like glycosyltransferase
LSTCDIAILIFFAAILAEWILRAVAIYRPSSRGPVLSRETIPAVPAAGLVSVIVPAKDEEANIRAALETLRAQDYPELEILVVSDRSCDRTAEIVREVAAADPRVHLVEVTDLPPGWFGKPHAMHVGAGEARGRWLLFVDADCRQAPHSVRAGVHFLAANKGDMLSLWPILELHGFWETAVQLPAGSVLVTWFRPTWVNNPRRRAAFANGQYILIRREAYEAVGGYESIRSELVEDIALARRVKRAGHGLFNAVGMDLFTTRMYASLGAMYRGWTRIYTGAFRTAWRVAAVMLATFIFALLPFIVLTAASVAMACGDVAPLTLGAFALSLATVGAILVTMRRFFVLSRANSAYLVFYPIAVVAVLVFQAGAVVRALGLASTTWRGTTYKSGKVVGGG